MAILPDIVNTLPDVKILGALNTPVTGVSIDTRSLNAGDLFVAFIGTQVDGHDYIPKAISRGASAVMASTSWVGCETWDASIPLIMTEDPVKSLADLATAHRKLFKVPIIAITGTNGKTSTKNVLAHILGKHFSVLSTSGNYNNHIGLPLTLLGLNETHEMAVVEMGASQRGDIEYLCEIAQPTQGLITNISLAHAEFFHDLDTIQSTKGELFQYLEDSNGRIYVNLDDERVAYLGSLCTNPIQYSFNQDTEHKFMLAGPDTLGTYDLEFTTFSAHLSQPGKAFALNAASAATIALHNGVRYDQVQHALEDYPGEFGRMQHEEVAGVHFYNDAYNSNPASAQAGFETMAEIDTRARKILIFGDMLELGELSSAAHVTAGAHMIAAGFDHIMLYGKDVRNTYKYLQDQGFESVHYTTDKPDSLAHFLQLVSSGDMVYLKGSRSMQLEDYLNAYKENN